ncbi:hypothetical protein D3C73_1444690 [compost metagenome]
MGLTVFDTRPVPQDVQRPLHALTSHGMGHAHHQLIVGIIRDRAGHDTAAITGGDDQVAVGVIEIRDGNDWGTFDAILMSSTSAAHPASALVLKGQCRL